LTVREYLRIIAECQTRFRLPKGNFSPPGF